SGRPPGGAWAGPWSCSARSPPPSSAPCSTSSPPRRPTVAPPTATRPTAAAASAAGGDGRTPRPPSPATARRSTPPTGASCSGPAPPPPAPARRRTTRRTPDVVATRRPDPAPALLPAGEGTPSPVERVVRRLRRARFRSKVLRRPLVEVRRLGLGPDDALIASYPRSGTNWLMFLVAEAITGEPSQFGAVHRRIPYIGGQRRAPRLLPDGGRIVYTHETHPIGRRRAVYLVR